METRGVCGAVERSGDSEGSRAGTQRTENGTFLTAATEKNLGIMPGAKQTYLLCQ